MEEVFYLEFANSLKDMLSEQLIGCETSVQRVKKKNGLEYLVLVVEQGNGLLPVIPVDTYYEEYMDGEPIELICDTIIELCNKYLTQKESITQFTDLSGISDKILLKLVNADKYKETLLNLPHRLFHDLAVTYHLLVEDEIFENVTVSITNDRLSSWNMNEKALYELALRNTQVLLKSVVKSMDMVLDEIQGDFSSRVRDTCGEQMINLLESMFLLSNRKTWFGAAVMLFDDVLEEIADMLQHDFFILPSSVHELIILPVKPDMSTEHTLIQMVRDVNECEVEEDQKLSDNIYVYHIEGKYLEMIGSDK